MKLLFALLVVVSVPAVPAALADASGCGSNVWDRTGLLNPTEMSQLMASTYKLTELGADTHIVIYGDTSSVTTAENDLELTCAAYWTGPTGVRASTLLVLAVSPASHKSWISYGSAWHHALDNDFNRIRVDDMNPYFKNKEWAKGLESGAEALAARMTAAKDESLHPAQTTVEATDLKPVAHTLDTLLIVSGCCVILFFLTWGLIEILARRRKARAAQQSAQTVRSNLASRMQKLDQDITAYHGENLTQVMAARDRLSEDFSRYSSAEKMNPDTNGLSAEEYAAIEKVYVGLSGNLEGCYRIMLPGARPEAFSAETTSRAYAQRQAPPQPRSGKGGTSLGPDYASQAQQPGTVVIHDSSSSFSDGFLGGMLGADLANSSRDRDRDYPGSYDPPASHSSWGSSDSSSSSSSSDSGGGGGSDWSSSSDSGGGGGGGSDFSSSSDSGGGGGGDF